MAFLKEGKTNWKFIIIILAFAILVGGGVLFWIKIQEVSLIKFPGLKNPEKPLQDKTADWETYRNEEYGYEIKYPKDWMLDEGQKEAVTINSPENEKLHKKIESGEVYGEGYMRDITIIYYNSIPGGTFDEFVKRELISSLNPVNFAGQNAYEAIMGHFGAYHSILIEKNNHLYIIQFGNREDKSKLTKTDNQILSTFKFTKKDETAKCSSIDIPNYEVAKNNSGNLLEFYVDLNGDRKEEFVRVYGEHRNEYGERYLPIMVKIFSGPEECQKEEFSYKSVKENEVYLAEVMNEFWGDGGNAVMAQGVSTGYGSGSSVVLRFFTYRNGEYAMIEGPQLGGHNWQCCKFVSENGLGKKIIGAESRWAPDYSDYCAGCPSRFEFFISIWNGKEYITTKAGTTKNRYSGGIDEILQKEPSVLEELE